MDSNYPSKITYYRDIILGKGAYATVFQGIFDGQQVAVKRVQLVDIEDEREILAMEKLSHPNVVKLYFSHQDGQDFKLYALELCAATLLDYCKGKYTGPMPSKMEAMIQMAEGLHYIHSKRLVHRDIKPGNILISITDPVQLKLGDFGLSKPTDSGGNYSLSGIKGTEDWVAPELLELIKSNKPFIASNVSDIFSLGCVFFYFLVRFHPFGKHGWISINIGNDRPIYWDEKAGKGVEFGLIRLMIRATPQQRIDLPTVICMLRVLQGNEMLLNSISCQLNENGVERDRESMLIQIEQKSSFKSNNTEKKRDSKTKYRPAVIIDKMTNWVKPKGKFSGDSKPEVVLEQRNEARSRPLSLVLEETSFANLNVNDQEAICHSKDVPRERRFSALTSQLQKPTEYTNPVNDTETVLGTKLRKTQSLKDSSMRDRYLANASKKSSKLERSNSISISKSPNSKYQSDELAMEPGEVRRKVQMFASKEESGDGYTSPKDRVYGSPPSNISREEESQVNYYGGIETNGSIRFQKIPEPY